MLKLFVVLLIVGTAYSRVCTFTNNLPYDLTVASLGTTIFGGGDFILAPGESRQYTFDEPWSGRIWGKTFCDPGTTVNCESGDQGVPSTLAEMTVGDLDFYDVSLVDGFNIPVRFGPVDASGDSDGGVYSCTEAACPVDLNLECPDELKVVDSEGRTVACLSACARYATDEYCCGGDCCSTPDTCRSENWPVNYPEYFKSRCPLSYSYAYDDQASTFTCVGNHDYYVIFG